MAFITRAGGVMALLTVPEVPIFRSGGIISAKDFNAIPDEEGDTILWGKGENAVTKADGIAFIEALNKETNCGRTDTIMDEGTWLAEVFHSS